MKFPIAATLLCSAIAIASDFDASFGAMATHQLVRRAGINIVEQGLYNISNSTAALTKDIAGFSLAGLFSLQTANQMAVQTIENAIAAIKPIDALSTDDALALVPIITMLAQTTNESITTTINTKPKFGGIVPVVKANLQQQLQASNILTLTISQKLPKALVATSAQLSAPIVRSLNMGIMEFSTPVVNTPQNSPELFSSRSAALPAAVINYSAVLSTMLVATIFTMA